MNFRPSRARDRLARALCNVILNTVATRAYRNDLEAAIQRGLDPGASRNVQTNAERQLAARIRVRADEALGRKTPKWIQDLAYPPKRRTPDIWDYPEAY